MASPKNKGFTLIELLVVIGIIAVLCALATSGISGVRQSSMQAQNINNLKQIATAYHAYAAENNGTMPPTMQNIKGGVGRMLTTGLDFWPHAGPRRLFSKDKWPFGTGTTDYLASPDVFHGPFTPTVNAMRKPGELWENVPTSYRIGYVYFSLPVEDDGDQRAGGTKRYAPKDKDGRPVSNDRTSGHPRAPLISDIYDPSWAQMTGFPLATQKQQAVVHLDGSISFVPREKSAQAKNRILCMAGLE
jgi:prepilin-type N-terminal cleavage/methylation domain-containing protein